MLSTEKIRTQRMINKMCIRNKFDKPSSLDPSTETIQSYQNESRFKQNFFCLLEGSRVWIRSALSHKNWYFQGQEQSQFTA